MGTYQDFKNRASPTQKRRRKKKKAWWGSKLQPLVMATLDFPGLFLLQTNSIPPEATLSRASQPCY